MGQKAVGAYLRYLREECSKTRVDVAVAIDTNESQIVRIEAGEIDTRGSLLLGFARAVSASLEDVADLLLDQAVTEDSGIYRAKCLLSERAGLPPPPPDAEAARRAAVHAYYQTLSDELDREEEEQLRRVLDSVLSGWIPRRRKSKPA